MKINDLFSNRSGYPFQTPCICDLVTRSGTTLGKEWLGEAQEMRQPGQSQRTQKVEESTVWFTYPERFVKQQSPVKTMDLATGLSLNPSSAMYRLWDLR